jgi:hypothetical protein
LPVSQTPFELQLVRPHNRPLKFDGTVTLVEVPGLCSQPPPFGGGDLVLSIPTHTLYEQRLLIVKTTPPFFQNVIQNFK